MAKCYFRSGNIAITDAQKASWMCFYAGYFNVSRTAWDTEDRKFSWGENGHWKNWRKWHQLLAALPPLFVAFCHFCHDFFPLNKRCTFLNGLIEYDCFKSFRVKRLHGNHVLEHFKPRVFNLAKKWNSTATINLFSLLNKDLQWNVLTIHGGYLF